MPLPSKVGEKIGQNTDRTIVEHGYALETVLHPETSLPIEAVVEHWIDDNGNAAAIPRFDLDVSEIA